MKNFTKVKVVKKELLPSTKTELLASLQKEKKLRHICDLLDFFDVEKYEIDECSVAVQIFTGKEGANSILKIYCAYLKTFWVITLHSIDIEKTEKFLEDFLVFKNSDGKVVRILNFKNSILSDGIGLCDLDYIKKHDVVVIDSVESEYGIVGSAFIKASKLLNRQRDASFRFHVCDSRRFISGGLVLLKLNSGKLRLLDSTKNETVTPKVDTIDYEIVNQGSTIVFTINNERVKFSKVNHTFFYNHFWPISTEYSFLQNKDIVIVNDEKGCCNRDVFNIETGDIVSIYAESWKENTDENTLRFFSHAGSFVDLDLETMKIDKTWKFE